MRTRFLVALCLGSFLGAAVLCAAGDPAAEKVARDAALKLKNDGNFKEAYDRFAKLANDPASDPNQVSADLTNGLDCLQRLGRQADIDDFREKTIAVHAGNWRLLQTAAQSYLNTDHSGSIVAGKFERGPHRGGTARFVNSYESDRVRALQLMEQGMKVIEDQKQPESGGYGNFYYELTRMLLGNRGYREAWRLQYLTDLSKLPDFEDGYYYGGGQVRGAPVNADGTPVLHYLPESWQAAKSDGERLRWAIAHAAPGAKDIWADFLLNQFGVQTMADYGWFFGRNRDEDDTKKDESGTYDLHTLAETETIARLANGIKRFKLLDEFNYIKVYQQIADASSDGRGRDALRHLGQIFEDRRQYDTAVTYWDRAGEKDRIKQIVGKWGQFEPVMTQPAGGQGATVEFRFRNGTSLSLAAYEINVSKLLDDVKAYIKSNPRQFDWQKMDIANLGYRLVEQNQTQYIGATAAEWEQKLEPRLRHWDKRVTLQTPLKKAGAYLVTAKMDDGNVSRIILWVADTAIVKKPIDKTPYYFVADAVSGRPLPGATLECFGWRHNWVDDGKGKGHNEVKVREYSGTTDADGQYLPKTPDEDRNYQWLITAGTNEGRLAYLGFTGVWWGNWHDQEYNQTKVFVITDRPVYRPAQAVKFKFWVNNAKYDQDGKSAWAGRDFVVWVNNPKGEKVFEKNFKADDYGGFDGELTLPKDATLGIYQIFLPGDRNPVSGGSAFRLEEYKKPEFEVKVEAPTEPVMLGEKITATIVAKYYFGAPVTEAKVKYKVMRSSYSANWYPFAYWDWFYGRGYWWYAYDYAWYPGWGEWGCRRPIPWWWSNWGQQPPEVVAEAEVPVGKDGVVKVEIDTAVAKAIYGDTDHRYEITAEVTDQSRRTIVGQGAVLVARKPFKVYAWVDRGWYRTGDVVQASFTAQTLDNKPVKGTGRLRLLKITYDRKNQPVEDVVGKWNLDTDDQGCAKVQIKAGEAGQYRLSYKVTDAKDHVIEGGYVFTAMGEQADSGRYRFNEIELVPDKKEYQPGEKVKLRINTNRRGGTVLLFVRPANGIYLAPKVLRLKGKSALEEIEVVKRDMPNFFIEAVTVSDGKVYTETKEIVVPPEKRVLDVAVTPSAAQYKPGEKAKIKVKLTDPTGEPYSGSTVVAVYDKSVEYISGGSNVPEIKEFFWKWRRSHNTQGETSLDKGCGNLLRSKEIGMGFLGVFGYQIADEELQPRRENAGQRLRVAKGMARGGVAFGARRMEAADGAMLMDAMAAPATAAAPGAPMEMKAMSLNAVAEKAGDAGGEGGGGAAGQPLVQPTVRSQFADTALWVAALQTNVKGEAEVELTMPENLTTWKARVWAMGDGTKCGEGSAEVVTTKNLIIRLQAPRFFVQKDEVVLSANVHNFLKTKKTVDVVLEMVGGTLGPLENLALPAGGVWTLKQTVTVDAGAEKRVDWRIRVLEPGEATVRMKALTDEESDAMEMKFPVYVHGMLKTESFCGVIRPDRETGSVTMKVPAERRPKESVLEVRYSPTLAAAMVDALPYMVDYPYGCTEQTLNRFLPTVITQKILLNMGLDLKEIQKKRTNLNAQEIGDDAKRAADWKRGTPPNPGVAERNPVFDVNEVQDMVRAGVERLVNMQCSDGGWGWFSGWGEHSYPHTTAVVVHGFQIAVANDVTIPAGVLERGVEWLKRYQAEEVRRLKLPDNAQYHKHSADDLDGFVYMVLVDAKADNREMRDFLYRDRNNLAVYTKAMFGIALHRVGDMAKRDMLIRNIEQFLVQDEENQTAYLKLPENNWWWCWYGSEYEAHAYYLKLLAVTDPKSEKASRLVKYLINNRKHATYWSSTRDTAVVIEAFADYIKASGEDQPDMTVQILVDGKQVKEVKINRENLFSFDNKLLLTGEAVTTGEHKIEFRKVGKGPLYFNAYLTNFTLEDPITRAGLEIKVNRKYYKLVAVEKKIKAAGVRGQAVDQKVEKYERQELANLAMVKSGDLIEIELEIDSKNDYEYIMFEDMKAAGCEPVELRSGYGGNDMGAYMELRDERVTFFVHALARGKHSVSYRMRAEIPGRFSALPTRASAMYAPELKANSDEIKIQIED